MAGKGMKPIVGYNHKLYRENYPFAERKTAAQWCEELKVIAYETIGTGQRMTEAEFREGLIKAEFVHKTEPPKEPESNQA